MTESNGMAEVATVPEAEAAEALIQLDLELDEADALHGWLLKATSEGVAALDDPLVSAALKKLSRSLDYVHTVATVREELEQSGFDTQGMSDDEVADLTRRIREANRPH
jgi:hypothetical protein